MSADSPSPQPILLAAESGAQAACLLRAASASRGGCQCAPFNGSEAPPLMTRCSSSESLCVSMVPKGCCGAASGAPAATSSAASSLASSSSFQSVRHHAGVACGGRLVVFLPVALASDQHWHGPGFWAVQWSFQVECSRVALAVLGPGVAVK